MEKVKEEEIKNKKTSSKTKIAKTENNTVKQTKKTATTNKKSSTTKANITKTNEKQTNSNTKTKQELNKANNVKKEKNIDTENKNVVKKEVSKTKKTTGKAPKTEKKQNIEQNKEDVKAKDIELVEEINIEEIKEKIQNQNKIPEEKHKTIKKNIIPNIGIVLILTIFHIFLKLGFTNIEGSNYVTDLKVFSGIFLIIAIYLFENAYNKDNSKLAIYGIEALILAIFNFSLVYIYYAWIAKYQLVVFLFAILVCIYYSIKSIVIYIKMKKEYVIEKY